MLNDKCIYSSNGLVSNFEPGCEAALSASSAIVFVSVLGNTDNTHHRLLQVACLPHRLVVRVDPLSTRNTPQHWVENQWECKPFCHGTTSCIPTFMISVC